VTQALGRRKERKEGKKEKKACELGGQKGRNNRGSSREVCNTLHGVSWTDISWMFYQKNKIR